MKVDELAVMQLKNLFALNSEEEMIIKKNLSNIAENKTIYCMTGYRNKYYGEEVNPYNSVLYCIYLYWLSHCAYLEGEISIAEKTYYLNKAMNAVELFYEVEMPEIWSCEHPLGAVMGRAKYGNYFFFYQGCTVGGNWHNGELHYPSIGNNVLMYSNSKILGKCTIGNNTIISANCYIKDQDVPDNSLVFGQSPNIVIKRNMLKIPL